MITSFYKYENIKKEDLRNEKIVVNTLLLFFICKLIIKYYKNLHRKK